MISNMVHWSCGHSLQPTVKAIILTRRIYNDFPKFTGLRVPKITILTYSQRSIGQYMYRFLYNDFYFNDRFLLVNLLELALHYIYIDIIIWLLQNQDSSSNALQAGSSQVKIGGGGAGESVTQ